MSRSSHWETALRALADPYRRQLLVALHEHNPQDDDDTDPLNVQSDGEEPDALPTDLVHQHLPMLADQGYIEWDREMNTVSRGPDWEQIGPIIRLMHRHRDELPDGWL